MIMARYHNVYGGNSDLSNQGSQGDSSTESMEDDYQIDKAIQSVVRTFRKNTQQFDVEVDVSEALEEFWKMKMQNSGSSHILRRSASYNNHRHFHKSSQNGGSPLVESYQNMHFYEDVDAGNDAEDYVIHHEFNSSVGSSREDVLQDDPNMDNHLLNITSETPIVCYVFLPGGSCFATQDTDCLTRTDARHSATKIALMNSIFNEHPSRRITLKYVQTTLSQLNRQKRFVSPLHEKGCQAALEFMIGKSFLEYQEFCTLLRLMNWAGGSFRPFISDKFSRQEALQQCFEAKVDDNLLWQLTTEVMEKERISPGFLNQHLQYAQNELKRCREAGRELRFPYEQRRVCLMAMQRCNCDGFY